MTLFPSINPHEDETSSLARIFPFSATFLRSWFKKGKEMRKSIERARHAESKHAKSKGVKESTPNMKTWRIFSVFSGTVIAALVGAGIGFLLSGPMGAITFGGIAFLSNFISAQRVPESGMGVLSLANLALLPLMFVADVLSALTLSGLANFVRYVKHPETTFGVLSKVGFFPRLNAVTPSEEQPALRVLSRIFPYAFAYFEQWFRRMYSLLDHFQRGRNLQPPKPISRAWRAVGGVCGAMAGAAIAALIGFAMAGAGPGVPAAAMFAVGGGLAGAFVGALAPEVGIGFLALMVSLVAAPLVLAVDVVNTVTLGLFTKAVNAITSSIIKAKRPIEYHSVSDSDDKETTTYAKLTSTFRQNQRVALVRTDILTPELAVNDELIVCLLPDNTDEPSIAEYYRVRFLGDRQAEVLERLDEHDAGELSNFKISPVTSSV